MPKAWSLTDREGFKKIVQRWRERNQFRQATFILGLAIYMTVFMIFFDHVFVENVKVFTILRTLGFLVLLPAFMLSIKLRRNQARWIRTRAEPVKASLLLVGPVIFHAQYLFFVFVHDHDKIPVYFVGLTLVVFYGSFVLHKFSIQQALFNIAGALSTLAMVPLYPEKADYAYIVVVCHMTSLFIFTYFRRDFTDNLTAMYSLLRIMVPAQVAEVLATSYETTEATKYFKPSPRFTVCLCADWRGFQQIASMKTSDEVSELLEKFYDAVLAGLENLVPANRYYFNWMADELFIVFFSDEPERAPVLTDAIRFALLLKTEIFERFRADSGVDVYFDIGLAAGIGLLGLQGPRHMKKTTITGEVAGRSKRYESEARRLRQESLPKHPPILVIDELLFEFALAQGLVKANDFQPLVAKERDIVGSRCYVCTAPSATDGLSDQQDLGKKTGT